LEQIPPDRLRGPRWTGSVPSPFPQNFLGVYPTVTSVPTRICYAEIGAWYNMHIRAFEFLRTRLRRRRVHLVAHIADTPQIIALDAKRTYMVFCLEEFPGTVFHLRMRPKTLKRHRGDRVEISFRLTDDATAVVESVRSFSDLEVVRQAERGTGG
jgi:hypothetical protein